MNYWQQHDDNLRKYYKEYNKVNKQTQNKIQELLDTFNITKDNLFNIADNKTKKRINEYIEEWKELDLYTGSFKILADNIYNRRTVKNNEILELLIYFCYIEEQSKIKNTELNIMKDTVNIYYREGQKEVLDTLKNKKKRDIIDITDILFLSLLAMPNSMGWTWEQYIELTIRYNANELYRQTLINLQQDKEIDILSDEFQRIINRQKNQRVSINDNKISGVIDLELIGLNNLAKVEGINIIDNDAQVIFMATIDGKETDMCHSLDNQKFYINRENEFDRYYGEIQKDLTVQRIKCFGLVLGLNLPPISHHFHWCRSSVGYIGNTVKKESNLDIAIMNKDLQVILKDEKLPKNIERLFNKYLTNDNVIIDNDNTKAMYYDPKIDKIIINNKHETFNQYNLKEALTHEIMHMIDKRNKLLEKNTDIYNDIRRAKQDIGLNIEKYQEIFKQDDYFYDLCSGDTIGLLTENKVKTFYFHPKGYANIEEDIMANIETAYLTNNKTALELFEGNKILKKLKDKVVKIYDKYTR